MSTDPFRGLHTPRLLLRRLTEDDAPAFAAYRADPEVARYQSWSGYTLADAKALIAAQAHVAFAQPGSWCQVGLVRRDTGILLGDCAYHTHEDDPRQAEIGFTVASAHQQQGFATEGTTALLDHVFRECGVHRISATIDVSNEPAAALLERLGFRREAHFVENIWFKGSWGSEYVYAILKNEWSSPRS